MNKMEKLIRESILEMKSKWELPKFGFLSGGSLANIIWEKVSGNKAVVNDIDIYTLTKKIDKSELDRSKQNFHKKEKVIYEDYNGLNVSLSSTAFYMIDNVKNEGILNIIEYSSTTEDPSIIIESFDINCCQVGYDILNDKVYWTKEFEEFLKTGKLKLINLSTPAHSAIRLAKKESELNVKADDLEFKTLIYAIDNQIFTDTTKFRFKQRYADIFIKYRSRLDKLFSLERDIEMEENLRNSIGSIDFLYKLKPISLDVIPTQKVLGTTLSRDFLYWVRNIFKNEDLEEKWFNLHLIFDVKLEKYLDYNATKDEIRLLNSIIINAPDCIRHLYGFTLSHQMYIVNTLLNRYKNDPIVAISIMEQYRIDQNINLENEMDLLLLELSVRKKILDDPKNKIGRIFHINDDTIEYFL
jgi:hypothetical protein